MSAVLAVEHDAGELFRTVPGYQFCADAAERDSADYVRAFESGALLVAEALLNDGALIVGFALLWKLDARLHLAELGTLRSYQRRGIGRSLLERSAEVAPERGLAELSLTTFRDVPWNAPYYARCGFVLYEPGPEDQELRALIADEAAAGLAAKPRVTMVLRTG